jgi:cytochrome c556
MKMRIALSVLCLLLGGLAGSSLARHFAQRHQHARAVMWLAQIHLDRMTAAAQTGQCPVFEAARLRLGLVQQELILAFPLAYEQEADFRLKADALASAVQDAHTQADACSGAKARIRPIHDACDACHRDYR